MAILIKFRFMRSRIIPVLVVLIVLFSVGCKRSSSNRPADFAQARDYMITHDLVPRGIADRLVLKAMGEVPREEFVPPESRSMAYEDRTIPIGNLSTVSQPYIVALMTEAVQPQPGHKVLEIGTASGYQAALLSTIVKDVYTIEIVDELAKTADERLKKLGYNNVHVKAGDGFFGWPDAGPFDGIIVTCAAPRIPEKLAEQLAEGGRMILPLGENFSTQILTVVSKKNGQIESRPLADVRFVPMQGEIKKESKDEKK